MIETLEQLRRAAREIFDDALAHMDAGDAVRRAVSLDGERLSIFDEQFNLDAGRVPVYSVAIGKAAGAMASALEEILDERLAGGVLAAPASNYGCSARWRVYAGGHPEPNEASLAAARASFDILRRADKQRALVIFLISGGGSAMLELPRDEGTTLADLREANRVLVTCGASIAEINALRRAISAIKGGGLAAQSAHAAQVTLIVSDTGAGAEANVASGPTLPPPVDAPDTSEVVKRYDLDKRLPESVLRAIRQHGAHQSSKTQTSKLHSTHPAASPIEILSTVQAVTVASTPPQHNPTRRHYVLLDNEAALRRAAEAARERGFKVELADDLVEQPVAEGSAMLVSRLIDLHARSLSESRAVCLISGGEFACPVRGEGTGGRNAETALRCALEMDARASQAGDETSMMVALSAGTDGIDGNSPATGALADSTTISRARAANLNPHKFLDESDAYTFFSTLGDAIITGLTHTNVRDLRIMIKG